MGAHRATPRHGEGKAVPDGGLDSEAFLKLLVAQLRYQNPLQPTDHSAMLQQTAQFTQIETLQQVARTQQQLLGLSHATMAGSLIGREVSAQAPDGTEVGGTVEAVRFGSSGAVLVIGAHEVPLSAAVEIRS